MALDALWAVLIPEVSQVSQVQAPIRGGFTDTPTVLPEVSEVSAIQGNDAGAAVIGGSDTPDTPLENVRYQVQPAWALGCTLDTPDTCKTIQTEAHAANQLLAGDLLTVAATVPKRVLRQHGPWLTDRDQSSAAAYHLHHFNCPHCIAAGRGARYGVRCAVGLVMCNDYTGADTTSDL